MAAELGLIAVESCALFCLVIELPCLLFFLLTCSVAGHLVGLLQCAVECLNSRGSFELSRGQLQCGKTSW